MEKNKISVCLRRSSSSSRVSRWSCRVRVRAPLPQLHHIFGFGLRKKKPNRYYTTICFFFYFSKNVLIKYSILGEKKSARVPVIASSQTATRVIVFFFLFFFLFLLFYISPQLLVVRTIPIVIRFLTKKLFRKRSEFPQILFIVYGVLSRFLNLLKSHST